VPAAQRDPAAVGVATGAVPRVRFAASIDKDVFSGLVSGVVPDVASGIVSDVASDVVGGVAHGHSHTPRTDHGGRLWRLDRPSVRTGRERRTVDKKRFITVSVARWAAHGRSRATAASGAIYGFRHKKHTGKHGAAHLVNVDSGEMVLAGGGPRRAGGSSPRAVGSTLAATGSTTAAVAARSTPQGAPRPRPPRRARRGGRRLSRRGGYKKGVHKMKATDLSSRHHHHIANEQQPDPSSPQALATTHVFSAVLAPPAPSATLSIPRTPTPAAPSPHRPDQSPPP